MQIKLGIWKGVAGHAVYLGDTRIGGPRDNGEMHLVKEWSVDSSRLEAILLLETTEQEAA